MQTKFGEILKRLRNEKGLTQQQLADIISVGRATIAGYETKGKQPDYDKLEKLSKYFNVSVDYLIGNTDKLAPNNININKSLDDELEVMLKKLESDGSALMYKGEPINDATKEALLISLKNTLELADKMHKMDKNK